jgi:hypothetical protein
MDLSLLALLCVCMSVARADRSWSYTFIFPTAVHLDERLHGVICTSNL